jgi:hypothetical protein
MYRSEAEIILYNRLIQVVKARLVGVSGAFPVTRRRYLGCRKESTFPIKCGLTDRGNLLFGTFVTVEDIDGGATFRLGCCVMRTKKGFEKLFRGFVYARHSIATTRRLVQQSERPTAVSTLGFPIARSQFCTERFVTETLSPRR